MIPYENIKAYLSLPQTNLTQVSVSTKITRPVLSKVVNGRQHSLQAKTQQVLSEYMLEHLKDLKKLCK